MPILDAGEIVQNLITALVLLWFAFVMYSKMDKEKMKGLIDWVKGAFEDKK